MAKKHEEIDEIVEQAPDEEAPKTPRIQHDFLRQDLNDLRDAVNELHARG